jgi:hypothetical protein
MSDVGGKAENICSQRVFRILTLSRLQTSLDLRFAPFSERRH